jgi:hypothetical protein
VDQVEYLLLVEMEVQEEPEVLEHFNLQVLVEIMGFFMLVLLVLVG